MSDNERIETVDMSVVKIVTAFELLPLWHQMFVASRVLQRASDELRYAIDTPWTPTELGAKATDMKINASKEAERQREILAIADAISSEDGLPPTFSVEQMAEALHDKGLRRVDL